MKRPPRLAEARCLCELRLLLHARPVPPSVVTEEDVIIGRVKGEAHGPRIGRRRGKVKSEMICDPGAPLAPVYFFVFWYVPINWVESTTCVCIACWRSAFLGFLSPVRTVSSAYSLKK